jgi:tetratricopeptide (TPR) repeat protein
MQRRMERQQDCNGRQNEASEVLRAQHAEDQMQALVKEGDYAEALELAGTVDQAHTADIQRSASYVAAVNGLIDIGLEYLNGGEFKQAGSTFNYLIKHMPPEDSSTVEYRKTAREIRSLLSTCEETLMKQAVTRYRNGNLEGAIEAWQAILSFNPNHVEARKALKTATAQLHKLEQIGS